ncbi:hypothetical protein COLO4_15687 [Corchorus olitorius]|uniref:FAR1 domain-containing protein n=1 Tax=Corchorus olitorius TaxID=93759 RepID=A0A1R3JM01_9ROSI|nr:hypothetical protein COLO4_15687 [Corchorus olitorius]
MEGDNQDLTLLDKNDEGFRNSDYLNREDTEIVDLMGAVVNNADDAYKLYQDYGYRMGFSVRKAKNRYHTGTKIIRTKEFYCAKQGFKNCSDSDSEKQKKFNKLETITGCQAKIRFTVEDGQWKVTQFVSEHNHDLATPSKKHLLRSARLLEANKAKVIDSMVTSGIRPTDVYSYLSNEAGGGLSTATTSLTKFFIEFEKLVARWRSSEGEKDFQCMHGSVTRAIKNCAILVHASEAYTHEIYKRFEKEFLDGIALTWKQVSCEGTNCTFEVEVVGNDNSRIRKIPEKYILKRWTKDAKKRVHKHNDVVSSEPNSETESTFRNRRYVGETNRVSTGPGRSHEMVSGPAGAFTELPFGICSSILGAAGRGHENFGVAMFARCQNGDSIILCRSIKAQNVQMARILLVRLTLFRLLQLGVTNVWCSFDKGKWISIIKRKPQADWRMEPAQVSVRPLANWSTGKRNPNRL